MTGRNEFASGGLVLMIIGGISVWLRAVPERIWEWIDGWSDSVIEYIRALEQMKWFN